MVIQGSFQQVQFSTCDVKISIYITAFVCASCTVGYSIHAEQFKYFQEIGLNLICEKVLALVNYISHAICTLTC